MNIQKKIKDYGFTIAEVAEKMKNSRGGIGISQGSLSTALNANPTISRLQEIADIIGCTLPELVADNEDNNHVSVVCPHCGKIITLDVHKIDKE